MTAPKAPRRKRRTPEERRDDIVQAAFALFRETGFSATRMEDVAHRAGVAKGTLYLYFADKESLFQAVVEATILPMIGHVETLIRSGGADRPPADRLHRLLSALYDELVDTDRREVVRMIIAESGRFPALAAFYHREVIQRARAVLAGLLADGLADGSFRAGPIHRTPEAIIGPALMAVVWRLVFEETAPLDRDAFLAAHVDLVLNGLLKR